MKRWSSRSAKSNLNTLNWVRKIPALKHHGYAKWLPSRKTSVWGRQNVGTKLYSYLQKSLNVHFRAAASSFCENVDWWPTFIITTGPNHTGVLTSFVVELSARNQILMYISAYTPVRSLSHVQCVSSVSLLKETCRSTRKNTSKKRKFFSSSISFWRML